MCADLALNREYVCLDQIIMELEQEVKNCEEIGLFEEHVNPFEETFRRVCEQSVYQSLTIHQNSASFNTNEDALHTR